MYNLIGIYYLYVCLAHTCERTINNVHRYFNYVTMHSFNYEGVIKDHIHKKSLNFFYEIQEHHVWRYHFIFQTKTFLFNANC